MAQITSIELRMNDVTAQIDPIGRVIIIQKYVSSSRNVSMTICYGEDWAMPRALQHAQSILEAAITEKIL